MSLDGSPDVDRGWAWVVLGAAFFAVFLNGFTGYSVGVLTTAMLDRFGEDLAKTSAVGSLVIAIQCMSGPLVGLIINKIGCRTTTFLGGIVCVVGMAGASVSTSLNMVLLTFGVLVGLGLGLGYIPAVVVIGHYFHRLRPFASGVTVTGGGLGMIVGPPFVRMVIDFYGLSGTFLIMGAVTTHFCVIGLLMRISPVEIEINRNRQEKKMKRVEKHPCESCCCCLTFRQSPEEETFKTNQHAENNDTQEHIQAQYHTNTSWIEEGVKKLVDMFNTFTQGSFICFVLSIAAWNAGEAATLVHLPNYITQKGFSREHAASLYMAMGLANIPSRLLTGYAANDENISGLSLLSGQMGIAAILTMTFPYYSDSYTGQLMYVIGLGLYISGANSLMNPLTVKLLGLKHLASGFGIVMLMAGVGYLSGAPIAGMIVDGGGTYSQSYMFAGSLYLLSSILALSCAFFQTTTDKEAANPEITLLVDDVLTTHCNDEACFSEIQVSDDDVVQRDPTLLMKTPDVLENFNFSDIQIPPAEVENKNLTLSVVEPVVVDDVSSSEIQMSPAEVEHKNLTLSVMEPVAVDNDSSFEVQTSPDEVFQRDLVLFVENPHLLNVSNTIRHDDVITPEIHTLNVDHIQRENIVPRSSDRVVSSVS